MFVMRVELKIKDLYFCSYQEIIKIDQYWMFISIIIKKIEH